MGHFMWHQIVCHHNLIFTDISVKKDIIYAQHKNNKLISNQKLLPFIYDSRPCCVQLETLKLGSEVSKGQ